MSSYDDYKLTGNVLSDREKVQRALNDDSLSYEQQQSILRDHNNLNLDNIKMPRSREDDDIRRLLDRYVITPIDPNVPYTPSTPQKTYTLSTRDKLNICQAEIYKLSKENQPLFDRIDHLKYSLNPFTSKQRQLELSNLSKKELELYEQYSKLLSEEHKLKKILKKEERSDPSEDFCSCNGSGGCY